MGGDQDLTSHSSLLFPCGAVSPYFLSSSWSPNWSLLIHVWFGTGNNTGMPRVILTTALSKWEPRKRQGEKGFLPQTRGWGAAGQHLCHSLCCSFTAALLSESAPFAMRGAEHCLLSRIKKETRKINATLSYCIVQGGWKLHCSTPQSALCS